MCTHSVGQRSRCARGAQHSVSRSPSARAHLKGLVDHAAAWLLRAAQVTETRHSDVSFRVELAKQRGCERQPPTRVKSGSCTHRCSSCRNHARNSTGSPWLSIRKRLRLALMTACRNSCGLTYYAARPRERATQLRTLAGVAASASIVHAYACSRVGSTSGLRSGAPQGAPAP